MKDKIWLKNYPDGVNSLANLNEYNSFAEFLDDGFENYSDLFAFENMGKSITYNELNTLSKNFYLYLT